MSRRSIHSRLDEPRPPISGTTLNALSHRVAYEAVHGEDQASLWNRTEAFDNGGNQIEKSLAVEMAVPIAQLVIANTEKDGRDDSELYAHMETQTALTLRDVLYRYYVWSGWYG